MFSRFSAVAVLVGLLVAGPLAEPATAGSAPLSSPTPHATTQEDAQNDVRKGGCLESASLRVAVPPRDPDASPLSAGLSPSSSLPLVGWAVFGFVFGVALSLGSILAYRQYGEDVDDDTQWIEVPLVSAGSSLDPPRDTRKTFPLKTDALSQPIMADDVVAIDEGDSVRCVATLQVVRFFT
jgi:hypothetical protein